MKRLLMMAAVAGGLMVAGTTSTAEAHPGGFGGGYHNHFHGGGRGFYRNNGYGRFGGPAYRTSPGIFIGTPGFQFGYGTGFVQPYSGWGGGYGYRGGCGW